MPQTRLNMFVSGNGFFRSVGTLVSASILGQAILIAVAPITTRLYGPADFGLFAVFTGVFSVLLVGSSLRYELAIPQPRGEGNAASLLRLTLSLNAIVATLVGLMVAFGGDALSSVLNTPELTSVLWLLPLAVLGAGTYRAFNFWAIRQHNFGTMAHTKVVQSVVNATFQIACGLIGSGAVGLILGQVLGLTVGAHRLSRNASLNLMHWSRLGFLRMQRLAVRYSRFPKFDVAAALTDTLSVQLPNLLLAVLFTAEITGHYLLAERVLGVPLSLLSQSVGQVFYARSRKAVEDGKITSLTMKVSVTLAIIVIIPAMTVFFAGEPLFVLIFGDAWREAGIFAGWLIVGFAAQFIFSSISLALMATDAQKLNFFVHLCMLVAKAGALLYGYAVGSPLVGIIAFTFVNLVGYLGATVVVVRHTRRFVLANAKGQSIGN